VTASVVESAEGRQRHFVSVLNDVGERRRAETDLHRLRAAMDTTIDSIFVTDPATMRFLYVNDAACRRLGYTREQLLHVRPYDVAGKERAQVEREYAEAIAAGESGTRTVVQFHRSDGATGWSELYRRGLRTEEGVLVVTIGRDISERKQAERVLRESEERFRSLTELSSDFYWESDAEHRMQRVSHGS